MMKQQVFFLQRTFFILIALYCLLLTASASAQPARKAWMGANGSFSERGFAIDTVYSGMTFASMKIQKEDTVIRINGNKITDAQSFGQYAGNIRTGDEVHVLYKRGDKELSAIGKGIMRPYDTSSIADVIYDWVDFKECKLRTIVRKPKGKTNLPAVLLVPGYNCGSIENYSQGIYAKLMNEWIKNGFAVVTIEKTGLGDSYHCEPCSEALLTTDIQTFDAGYRYMEGLPFVDKKNLFIWGHSMGGIIAPEIARMHEPRGVIAYATVFRPWSEFLLEMHRVQWPLDGKSYVQTEKDLRLIQKAYYGLFVERKSPAQLYQDPELKEIVATELEFKDEQNHNMWGRHWHFWQQIDSLNMAESWSAVKCPVLSVFGGADFIACSELEHQLITEAVNAAHPGNATHITIPDIDHLLTVQKNRKEAHDNFSNTAYRNSHFHYGFTRIVNEWMKKQLVQ